MATVRSSRVSLARYTSPMPPRPAARRPHRDRVCFQRGGSLLGEIIASKLNMGANAITVQMAATENGLLE